MRTARSCFVTKVFPKEDILAKWAELGFDLLSGE